MSKKLTNEELKKQIAALKKEVAGHKRENRALKARERHQDDFFEHSPIAQSEFDCSKLKAYFESLRKKGVKDFGTFFRENDDAVEECAKRIKPTRMNRVALDMFGTKTTKGPEKNLSQLMLDPDGVDNFRRGMAAMAGAHGIYR